MTARRKEEKCRMSKAAVAVDLVEAIHTIGDARYSAGKVGALPD
jgi:hypothetical protein